MTETAKRYLTLISKDNTSRGDVERYQLFYLIASVDDLWKVAKGIYDFENHRVQENPLEHLYSGTYTKMLKRSLHLYNSHNEDINTVQLYWGMDESNVRKILNCECIYNGIFDFEKFLADNIDE